MESGAHCATLRPPGEVMLPRRLGATRLTRLSFSRSMVRHIVAGRWNIQPVRFDLDADGRGDVVYSISAGDHELTFIAFSDQIPEEEKSDRVIANRWDATASLCDGPLTESLIERLRAELPRQEQGRAEPSSLVWTRGNRSSRFFDHVVDSLTAGRQPDTDLLARGGYVFRSTAFYANGKFGTAMFDAIRPDHPLAGPFRAQMFTAFMLRQYSLDLVEHMARKRSSCACRLDPRIKRYLGLGNATGLGMVPFVIAHPKLVHTWCLARERALAAARDEQPRPGDGTAARLAALLDRCRHYFADLAGGDPHALSATVSRELASVRTLVEEYRARGTLDGAPARRPWDALARWAGRRLHIETQEVLHALLVELYPETAARLERELAVPETYDVVPGMRAGELHALLRRSYGWALNLDADGAAARYYFWYRSSENAEPRLGVRGEEPGDDRELPLDVVIRVHALEHDLAGAPADESVAAFLLRYPEHRFIVERVQSLQGCEYGEVRGNLLAEDFLPLDLMRLKLALFGADRFDPVSNKWIRVTLLQGAPTAEDVRAGYEGDWIFPLKPVLGEAT